jgi:hypothetical protein
VYRGGSLLVSNVTVSNYSDTGLSPETQYCYTVTAVDTSSNESAESNQDCATTQAGQPPDEVSVIAYESFEGYALGDLGGQGSAGGGWAGGWGSSSSQVVDVSGNPLSANGKTGGGTAVSIAYGNENGRRTFATALDTTVEPVYVSYLFRWDAGNDGESERAWLFNTQGNWDHYFAGLDGNSSGGDFCISAGYGNKVKGGPEFTVGDTVMVVVRADSNGEALWINPSSETDTPDITHPDLWGDFPGVGLTNRQGDETFLIDRIMIGRTFSDVTAAEPDATAPAAPTNLTATAATSTRIALDWDDNTEGDVHSYNVYRGTSSGVSIDAAHMVAGGVIESHHTDASLAPDSTYYYRVTAVDCWGNESGGSSEASATTLGADYRPILFLDAARIAEIQSAVTVAGTHHYEAYNAMKARVDQNDWTIYEENTGDGNYAYARSWLAREAAMMYLVTEDTWYADVAYDALYSIYNDPDPDGRNMETGSGLSRAMVSMAFGICYDQCYNAWSGTQQDWVYGKMISALDAWPSFSHPNFGYPFGSNWIAVCRGAELVLMLSAAEQENRASRYSDLKWRLNQHMQLGYGPTGWTQEGMGYASYGGEFLVPAVYACQSVYDYDLDDAFYSRAWWNLYMHAYSFTDDMLHIQHGVDSGRTIYNQGGIHGWAAEGWASLLLGSVPYDDLPYFRFAYDYNMGINSTRPADLCYDYERAGTAWALIYYPENEPSWDPDGNIAPQLEDTSRGAYYFRKQWDDVDDIIVAIMADSHHHDSAWDEAEAFGLGIIAFGNKYAGGPYKTRDPALFSSLLVDGLANADTTHTGAQEVYETTSDGGGYVIVDGGTKYANLGLDSAKRHLLVDYSGNGDAAVLSTLDRLQDASSHTYTWQLNLGDNDGDGGIVTSEGTESGVPMFVLSGDQGGYVKGWVLNATGVASITTGDPFQVAATAADADIWIVMVVGEGTPPTASVTGSGLSSVLEVNNARVYYDSGSNRIVSELR